MLGPTRRPRRGRIDTVPRGGTNLLIVSPVLERRSASERSGRSGCGGRARRRGKSGFSADQFHHDLAVVAYHHVDAAFVRCPAALALRASSTELRGGEERDCYLSSRWLRDQ